MRTDFLQPGPSDDGPEVVAGALAPRSREPKPLLKAEPDLASNLPLVGRPPRPVPWARLWRAAGSLVVAGILGAALFVWWDRTTIHPGGPVAIGAGGSGLPLDVEEPMSFGAFILTNRAQQPAVLEKVRILGPTNGFQVLGVRTNPVPLRPDVAFFIGAVGFPPKDYPSDSLAHRHVVPVSKTRTANGEPEEGLQLVVGARAGLSEIARARGVEVVYRVGPRRYRRTAEGSMRICAPKERYRAQGCPSDDEYFHDTVVELHVPGV